MLNKHFLVTVLAAATAITNIAANTPSSYAGIPIRGTQQVGKAAKSFKSLASAAKTKFSKSKTVVKKSAKGAKLGYKFNSQACKNDKFRNSSLTCKR